MRTIKFRGKCVKSGDWVYGDLIHGVGIKQGEVFILPAKTNLAYVKHCDPLDGVNVDPNTVGQYIGLEGSNGKEIYEGDIVDHIQSPYRCKVIYKHRQAQFMARELRENNAKVWQIKYKKITSVIGNIYDNPQLLNQNQP